MRTSKLNGRLTQATGLGTALILVAGCVTAGSVSAPADASTEGSAHRASAAMSTEPAPGPTGACGSADVSVDYAPYTVATLASSGWTFAEAVVTAFEPAIFNTLDGVQPRGFGVKPGSGDLNSAGKIFTPLDAHVDRVINGRTKPEVDRFLIEGGTVGCYTTRAHQAPVVELGRRYVFVLADAVDASGKTVLASQEAKFAWPVDDTGIVATPDGPESIDSLARIVAKASPTPSS